MKNSKTGELLGALLLGVAIGGALGILFAPEKGSEIRKKFLLKGGDLKEKAHEYVEELINDADLVKEKATDYLIDGKDSADHFTTG